MNCVPDSRNYADCACSPTNENLSLGLNMKPISIPPSGPFKDILPYSRVLRLGGLIWVAGTTPVDENGRIQGQTAGGQADYILNVIARNLETAGASIEDIVRLRIYLVDLDDAASVGEACRHHLVEPWPAMTVVGVASLPHKDMHVQIEADAALRS